MFLHKNPGTLVFFSPRDLGNFKATFFLITKVKHLVSYIIMYSVTLF